MSIPGGGGDCSGQKSGVAPESAFPLDSARGKLAVGISAEFTNPCPQRVPKGEAPKPHKLELRICHGYPLRALRLKRMALARLSRPGRFAIREGVNWCRAGTAQDSRLQVLLLQFGRSRATSHSRCPCCRYAKFWLDPVTLASNRGFRSHELTVIRELVLENLDLFLEKWNAYFSGQE